MQTRTIPLQIYGLPNLKEDTNLCITIPANAGSNVEVFVEFSEETIQPTMTARTYQSLSPPAFWMGTPPQQQSPVLTPSTSPTARTTSPLMVFTPEMADVSPSSPASPGRSTLTAATLNQTFLPSIAESQAARSSANLTVIPMASAGSLPRSTLPMSGGMSGQELATRVFTGPPTITPSSSSSPSSSFYRQSPVTMQSLASATGTPTNTPSFFSPSSPSSSSPSFYRQSPVTMQSVASATGTPTNTPSSPSACTSSSPCPSSSSSSFYGQSSVPMQSVASATRTGRRSPSPTRLSQTSQPSSWAQLLTSPKMLGSGTYSPNPPNSPCGGNE